MKIRTLVGAAMTGVFLSTAAFAASMSPAQQCTALEKKFDQEIIKHTTPAAQHQANLKDAVALRDEGASMCQTGMARAGVVYLHSAIRTLIGKPGA